MKADQSDVVLLRIHGHVNQFSPEVVIKALGLIRPRIYEWLAKYREGEVEALLSSKASGRPPKLPGNTLQKIYRMVVGKDPRQLKFPFALWTQGMLAPL